MNNNITEKFNYWVENASSDPDLSKELETIKKDLQKAEIENDTSALSKIENDLEDRFYKDLEFGTGGLRGIIGAGTNRVNHYTIARATQGLADYVKSANKDNPSVAIAYDSRHKSDYFAKISAQVLAGNGIKCYMYSELMPTPMLSYAVRRLKCDAGIVITASHNPAKYNGYKAYDNDGCQLSLEKSELIIERINQLDLFNDVKLADFDKGLDENLIVYIDDAIIEGYFREVKKQSIHKDVCSTSGLKVVYTPLNGAGNKPVRRILEEGGIEVVVVPEQEHPDGSFKTCTYPNPEFKGALEVGLNLCKKESSDLLLATDPDCDRVGIAVREESGEYSLFSGNEVGAMLLEYICRERIANGTMPANPVTVKSIVTSTIVDKVAAKYDVEVIDTLTGFKFIGGVASELEKKGEEDRYVFGFEESYGYLSGSYVRDKDAVCACMLICEMAAFYKEKGMSLIDVRRQMYTEYGYYYCFTQNIEFEGSAGMNKMRAVLDGLRKQTPAQLQGIDVVRFYDYSARTIVDLKESGNISDTNLPESNVIKLALEDCSVVIIRPSGTEPKLKIYYICIGENQSDTMDFQRKLQAEFISLIGI